MQCGPGRWNKCVEGVKLTWSSLKSRAISRISGDGRIDELVVVGAPALGTEFDEAVDESGGLVFIRSVDG